MFGPGWEQACPSCSFLSDHIDGANVHLAHRDVMLLAVSRAPLVEIEAFKKRMGWRIKWVSSYENDFNRDYHVSFTKDEMARGQVYYNYAMGEFPSEEAPGASVFYKDEAGAIFHTYSAYARGLDMLVGAYNYLDIVPKGRDEAELPWTMAWTGMATELVQALCRTSGDRSDLCCRTPARFGRASRRSDEVGEDDVG